MLRAAVTLEQCWHEVPGGTAWSAIELARAIDELGLAEVVGVSARHREPPRPPWTPPVRTRALPLPRSVLYETWHAPGIRFPKVERATGRVDVVHGTAFAYPAADAPIVMTIHDLSFQSDRRRATRHGHRFLRRGTELARRHARLIACPSRASADECIAAGFDPGRVRVVPWGVRMAPAPAEEVKRVREAHNLDQRYVMFAGTIEPRKNLPSLLEAFSRLDRTDVDLVLAGPRGWNEDVGASIGSLNGRVHTLGFVPRAELDALLAGADVFCYPSIQEGFGLPVLEAMAQGTAVVTSNGTATAEVAADAGVLVDPFDLTQITDALGRLLDDTDERERLGQAGKERAATFTWERAARGYVDLYTEACS